MASFADIQIRFGADIKQFSSQMQNAQRGLDQVGKKFQKVGAGLTVGVTAPLLALGGFAVAAAADFETLQSRLETALGSSSAAKQTFQEIRDFTKDLSITTDEAAESYIKLKNLGLDPSLESLKSFGNTAAAQGKSVNQLIEAVADAATGEFERLKEFGIKSSKQGEQVVFTFQGLKTSVGNNAEEIQDFLIGLGNTQFSGALEKQATTFNGMLAILKDNIKGVIADFGIILLEGIKPVVGFVQDLVVRFRELSPETKKFLVIFGGIAAAVGPLLALAGTILPAIGTGLAILTGPIGLIVAGLTAVGIVIYKNWEPIKATLVEIANYFVDLYNESTIFRLAVEVITTTFKNLFNVGKFVFGAIGDLIVNLATNIKNTFGTLASLVKAILTGNFKEIPALLAKNFGQALSGSKEFIKTLSQDFKGLKTQISSDIGDGINNALRGKKYELLSSNLDTKGVEDKVAGAVAAGLQTGASAGTDGSGGFTPQIQKLQLDTQGLTALGDLNFATSILDAIPLKEVDEKLIAFQSSLIDFQENSATILESAAENFVVGFSQILAGIANGTVGIGAIGALLLNTIGDIAIQLGRAAIGIGITMNAVRLAFATPFAAIAAGAGLVLLGTLLKSLSSNFAGNFANGGIVGGNSFTGDRLSAGVNSGELILNIAQQKNLAAALSSNSGNVTLQPSLDFSGDKLRVLLNRVENKRNRNT